MDVFDEFEMKPLTEGLGFHRKKEQISGAFDEVEAVQAGDLLSTPSTNITQGKSVDRATEALDKLMDSLNTLDKQGITFTDTLPTNKEAIPTEPITAKTLEKSQDTLESLKRPSIHPVIPGPQVPASIELPDPISETLDKVKDSLDELIIADTGARRGSSDSLVGNLKELSVSIPSAILDGIVVFALSLIFLIGMLVATETSLDTLVYSMTTDLMSQVSAGMLFVVVLQIYVFVTRCLFSSTLGEWTFDCQMGKDEELKTGYYPLQNVWRSLLMIGTGLVVLPILSLIARKDLARYLTGLQLYSRQ